MAEPGPGAAGDTGRGRPAGGLDGLIDQVTAFWKVSARSTRQIIDGSYSVGDAAQDLNQLISSSAGFAVRVADDLWGPDPPLAAYDGTWEATMHLLDGVADMQLTLRTDGLRAIGAPEVQIPPEKITFEPRMVSEGETKFKITVEMAPEHRRKTLIFEGEIVSDETGGAPVTDTVLANNRDDGPVR
jgi:hypothetical protein